MENVIVDVNASNIITISLMSMLGLAITMWVVGQYKAAKGEK